MAQQKDQPQRGPAPADNGDHACNPTPAKDPQKDRGDKPACPEGYQDRQPTEPPSEQPEQRGH